MGVILKKRSILVIIAVICVVTTIIVSSQSRPQSHASELAEASTPSLKISINSLITNDMSDLEQTKRFDKDIEAFMRRWEFTGASFALMRNDSLIYAKGYGFADKESSIECEVNHVFRIASASKLITATAIMKLAEEGKLSLTDQVFGEEGILCDSIFLDLKYSNLKQITVDHLLRHTSGFSSPHGDPAFANQTISRVMDKPLPLSVDDMVVYATQNRLRSRPGGSYDYSNLGYIILGRIIEQVTGVSYEEYVQNSILAPIGCYDMFIGRNFSHHKAPNEVRYYEVKEAGPVEAYDGSGVMTMKSDGGNNVTLLSSAGGWVASPVELLRFVAAVDGCGSKEHILSDKTVDIMTNKKYGRSIGWASTSKGVWLRSGSMAGTSALIKKQSNGYTWVFVVNNSAWIGPNISKYISSRITAAISKVKEWPQRDLFEVEDNL
ncbi:MAG: serine hydrolase domain-containing protein [Rikenellaceae bacterium]